VYTCEWCFGPLEVAYDYDTIARTASREKIAAGPASLWRYADLLPVAADAAVDLGTGYTPLVKADRLAAELGLGDVWVKNDTRNPTNSFKDRVTSVALSKALEFGFNVAACAATELARLPVDAQAATLKPNSSALLSAIETTRSLKELVGLRVSFLIHTSPRPSSAARRSARTSGVKPVPRSTDGSHSTGSRSA